MICRIRVNGAVPGSAELGPGAREAMKIDGTAGRAPVLGILRDRKLEKGILDFRAFREGCGDSSRVELYERTVVAERTEAEDGFRPLVLIGNLLKTSKLPLRNRVERDYPKTDFH